MATFLQNVKYQHSDTVKSFLASSFMEVIHQIL
jgi:hypothetical protein